MKTKNVGKSKFGNSFDDRNRFKCREIAAQKKFAWSLKGLLFLNKSATGWRKTVVLLLWQRISK